MPVSLKIEHSIHHMLKYARTCDRSFLGNMTDYKYSYISAFCKLQKSPRDLTDLTDGTRSSVDTLLVNCVFPVFIPSLRELWFQDPADPFCFV